MKTNSPTHEKIALLAQEIWNVRGNPSGCDIANWLDAERQLTAASPEPPGSAAAEPNLSPGAFGRNLAATS